MRGSVPAHDDPEKRHDQFLEMAGSSPGHDAEGLSPE
jgi:hypothetical protein